MDFTRLLVHLEIMANQLNLIRDHVEFMAHSQSTVPEDVPFEEEEEDENPRTARRKKYMFKSAKERLDYAKKCVELYKTPGTTHEEVAKNMPFSGPTAGRLIREMHNQTPKRGM